MPIQAPKVPLELGDEPYEPAEGFDPAAYDEQPLEPSGETHTPAEDFEPAAYGAAVVFGPHVWNFRDTAVRLVEAGAALQVRDAAELEISVAQLLNDPAERQRLGATARHFVRSQQGATERTLALLELLLPSAKAQRQAA